MLLGLLLYTLSLRNPHRRKSGGVRAGDHGGQNPHLTMQSVKKSSKKAVVLFTVFAFPHIAETSDPVHSLRAEQQIKHKGLENFLR